MPAEMSAKRFRIAFSFAGEKRDYVYQQTRGSSRLLELLALFKRSHKTVSGLGGRQSPATH